MAKNTGALRLGAVAATVLAVAACGRPAEPGAGASSSDDAVAGRSPNGPRDAGAVRVRPTPGLVDLRDATIARYRLSEDGRRMVLLFWDGPAPCSELDHVDIVYTERRVDAAVVVGRNPDVRVACPEMAVLKSVEVRLDEPAAGRHIDVATP
jgi:hypothetical protein